MSVVERGPGPPFDHTNVSAATGGRGSDRVGVRRPGGRSVLRGLVGRGRLVGLGRLVVGVERGVVGRGWLLGELGWVFGDDWGHGVAWELGPVYLVVESGPDVAAGGHLSLIHI